MDSAYAMGWRDGLREATVNVQASQAEVKRKLEAAREDTTLACLKAAAAAYDAITHLVMAVHKQL